MISSTSKQSFSAELSGGAFGATQALRDGGAALRAICGGAPRTPAEGHAHE
jgi:hypothetical protein